MTHSLSSPAAGADRPAVLRQIAEQFGLVTLLPAIQVCESLAVAVDGHLDVAVFGQFKSGKSSLLNAFTGRPLLPVGVVPVTAVITRLNGGAETTASVVGLDGLSKPIQIDEIPNYVTESRNPRNERQAQCVDVTTPALLDLPGLRLVDTPGLDSVFAHNTQITRDWLPNVAVALLAISAERPLSDNDLRFIRELRQQAPRVIVVLTKVDLLTPAEREEVHGFLATQLLDRGFGDVPVHLFSARADIEHWVAALKRDLLLPLTRDIRQERVNAIEHKLHSVACACREYLLVARHAAQRVAADRDRLGEAVLGEATQISVTQDELQLVAERVIADCRPAFETVLLAQREPIANRIRAALTFDIVTWQGHLAQQLEQFQIWLRRRLTAELEAESEQALRVAGDLVQRAEARLRRVVGAFQDRLRKNVTQETGITLSPVMWEVRQPDLVAPPITISHPFMTRWELLWWMLPMPVIGALFRRHCRGCVDWEVEKNLGRLVSDWSAVTSDSIRNLLVQARAWIQTELEMLRRMLTDPPADIVEIDAALAKLNVYLDVAHLRAS